MWKAILGGVLAVVLIGAVIYWLYTLGGDDQSSLEIVRDIVIVFYGFMMVIVTMLMAVAVAALAYLIIVVRRKLVPIMEKVVDLQEKAVSMQESTLDTLNRVKGTTDFVTEEVAAPIISAYGTVAKGRMMMKTVTGRDKGSKRKTTAKLLK
ncbi:MAG TPA: hypothetical protein VEX37_14860 [Thermomicrobiales bacterium]|nr:hypothetical protein [Thermomicrobiales bacterium]